MSAVGFLEKHNTNDRKRLSLFIVETQWGASGPSEVSFLKTACLEIWGAPSLSARCGTPRKNRSEILGIFTKMSISRSITRHRFRWVCFVWLASMAIISVVIFVMICVLAGATFITNGRPSGIPLLKRGNCLCNH